MPEKFLYKQHYDLTTARAVQRAIAAGAAPVDSRTLVNLSRRRHSSQAARAHLVSICVLLLLFVATLAGCGAETPPPAEKPAAQSEKAAVSPAAESAPSGEPTPAEPAKAAPQKPAAQPEDLNESAVKTLPARVTGVVDGDTVHVRLEGGKDERVRFIGVDAPESTRKVEPYGKETAAHTKKRLEGKTVYLELDVGERDRYGRLLAYVWLSPPEDGGEAEVRAKMFNAELLLAGFAQVMTVPPNVKYADLFVQFQREARENGRGLWGAAPQEPEAKGAFVGSVRSNKYHYPDCRWAGRISPANEIWFDSAADARAQGYEPCGVCRPPG